MRVNGTGDADRAGLSRTMSAGAEAQDDEGDDGEQQGQHRREEDQFHGFVLGAGLLLEVSNGPPFHSLGQTPIVNRQAVARPG